MLIGSRQRLNTFQSVPNLAVNGKPAKQVPHAKSLGVHIDENLLWNEHIRQIFQKDCMWYWCCVPLIQFMIPWFNHILTIVLKCGAAVDQLWPLDYKNYKTVQHELKLIQATLYDTNAEPLIESLGWKNLVRFSYSGAVLWNGLPVGLR